MSSLQLSESYDKSVGTPSAQTELRRGSSWALATLAMVSAGGFGFWVVAAATTVDNGAVGRAAAWFTLIQLVVTVGGLGVPILINRTAQALDAPRIAGMSAVVMIGLALVLGLLAPAVAGQSWKSLSGIEGFALGPLVALGAVGAALTLAVDARLISLRLWSAVFVRAAVPTVLRLSLLLLDPITDRATWISLVAVGPLALSGFVGLAALIRRGDLVLASPRGLGKVDRRFLGVQHLGAVATQAPYHIIPLLVARRVAGPTNAAFYLIWGIGVMTAMLPQTLTQVLLSETSLEISGRLSRIRVTLVANLTLAVMAWVGSLLLARPVLLLIGPTYADISPVLPWIVLASVAWGITAICLTEARLAHDGTTTALIAWTLAISSIGLGLLLIPNRPVWGATMAWLLANLLAMLLGVLALERRGRLNPDYLP